MAEFLSAGESSLYPRTYWVWSHRVLGLMFCLFLFLAGGYVLFNGVIEPSLPFPLPRFLLLLVVCVLPLVGIYLCYVVWRRRLVLWPERMVIYSHERERVIQRSDVESYCLRNGRDSIYPRAAVKECRLRDGTVTNLHGVPLIFDEASLAWFDGIASHSPERIEKAFREICCDPCLGDTSAQRLARVAHSNAVKFALVLLAYILYGAGLALHYDIDRYDDVEHWAMVLLPWLALPFSRIKGHYALEGTPGLRVGLSPLVIFPSFMLVWWVLGRISFGHFAPLWVAAVLLGMGVGWCVRRRISGVKMFAVYVVFYSFGVLFWINSSFDLGAVVHQQVVMVANADDREHVYVAPQGSAHSRNLLFVGRELARKIHPGDVLCVDNHQGVLGGNWWQVSRCGTPETDD